MIFGLACFLSCAPIVTFAQDGRSDTHVFAQFVDGRFSDGTFYRSALSWSNVPSSATTNNCTYAVRGVSTSVQSGRFGQSLLFNSTSNVTFNGAATGWDTLVSPGTGNFQGGYAVLFCDHPVNAELVYSFYAANGIKVSEATVLSSPESPQFELVVDQRGGARLGIALANDNDTSASVTITVTSAQNTQIGSTQIQIPAFGQIARFLSEFVATTPAELVGRVSIVSTQPLGVIGLRFTGGAFTTIPAFVRP